VLKVLESDGNIVIVKIIHTFNFVSIF